MADRIILAHERLDGVEVVEPHQGLEFDLAAEVALHQVDVPKARDLPRFDMPGMTSPRTMRSYSSAFSGVVQPRQSRQIITTRIGIST